MGYAGGTIDAPTYRKLGDHTEVIQLDFDPALLSYRELVTLVARHRRGGRAYSRQYMEAVFAADAEQEAIARDAGVTVPIIVGARFWIAEDYHQKYHLRREATLMAELAAYSPAAFVQSRVAARLNGYVAGKGTLAQLHAELPTFGLSSTAEAHLERVVRASA